MLGLDIHKPSVPFALFTVLLLAIGAAGGTPVPTVGGVSAPVQELNTWCQNLTAQITRTWMVFINVAFNRTTAFVKYSSSDVTEFQRLSFDRSDLKTQALIFPQLHPNATVYGNQVVQCIQINIVMYAGLVATMEMTELYLDGTIPSLPQLQGPQTSQVVKKIRYQAVRQEVAQLKALMRSAISIVRDMHVDPYSQDSEA